MVSILLTASTASQTKILKLISASVHRNYFQRTKFSYEQVCLEFDRLAPRSVHGYHLVCTRPDRKVATVAVKRGQRGSGSYGRICVRNSAVLDSPLFRSTTRCKCTPLPSRCIIAAPNPPTMYLRNWKTRRAKLQKCSTIALIVVESRTCAPY